MQLPLGWNTVRAGKHAVTQAQIKEEYTWLQVTARQHIANCPQLSLDSQVNP